MSASDPSDPMLPGFDAGLAKTGFPRSARFDEDFVELLEEQERRRKEMSRKANFVIFGLFGVMMASVTIWYVVSLENQRKVADLILDIKSSGNDFQMMSSPSGMASQYDKALAKIGTRSEDIDKATESLGVDPKSVKEDGMEPEMKQMMGGQGRTIAERDHLLRGELGGFAGLKKKKDAPESTAAPKVKVEKADPAVAPPANPTTVPVAHRAPAAR